MRLALVGVLLLATTLSAEHSGPRMRVGHDPAWASPHLDDSSWQEIPLDQVPHPGDSIWLRWTVDLTDYEREPGRPFGLYFGAMASHAIWWDGELIGRGGVVGRTKETEIPGPIEAHYQVPDRLITPAVHTVAIHASAFHRGFSPQYGYWALIAGNYDRIVAMRTRSANLGLIALSGLVLTAVFAFAMYWLTRRDRSFLLLGTLCLTAAGLLIAEVWRPLFGYTYDWHIVRLRTVLSLSWLTGIQLVALMVTRFPHRIGRWVLLATAVACSLVPFIPRAWDPKSILIFHVSVGVATLWAAWAVVRRLHGSVLALTGLAAAVLGLIIAPNTWLDHVVYFALDFLLICLLCSHALEVRREQHQRARLEQEMLRRQLQPHFLMNTLTALSEWIESDPKTAVRMIDALGEELRILGRMADRSLVPAEEELRLCRSHLANMSMRKDIEYTLEVDGVDGAHLVPPAVFHTLVENAITHGAADAPDPTRAVTFRLSAHAAGNRIRYTFEAPAAAAARDSAAPKGGGTRYIEARLREAWGDAWSFHQDRVGALWRAVIEVPA